jgi:alkylated DNA repair protein (DNA oxidative demethylase)
VSTYQFPDGFRLLNGYLNRKAQANLVEDVLARVESSPIFQPVMPRSAKPMSVRNTNFGPLGWVASQSGYRYQDHHPETCEPWPNMPKTLLDIWDAVGNWPDPPQACLVNWYGQSARLGMHIDADEDAKYAPVVSISLGDSAKFRLGGPQRGGSTASFKLDSGDIVVLGGDARRCYHGVDKIFPGTSTLLPEDWRPGRINLTLRRVN